jgi:hypothetical protein
MQATYEIKHWIKQGRWQARRAVVALRHGPDNLARMPAVLGNAMPKSGSHLIIQVLQGLTRLGPFVNPGFPPVNRAEDNHKLSDQEVLANIRRMRPGDIAYGYISAREPFLSALKQPGRATIFVYRDPRDMIISHIFYATQMHPDHWMHRYYTKELHTMEERINAAIQGVEAPGSELTPVRARYEGYLDWLKQPEVLSLRFERLILEREPAMAQILDYLAIFGFTPRVSRQQAIDTLLAAIAPRKSGTFRKGKPGNWQEHFTPENKHLFKQATGDLLIQLGYEGDQNW